MSNTPIKVNPFEPDKRVVYEVPCSNCALVDTGNTVYELDYAMNNHTCEEAE